MEQSETLSAVAVAPNGVTSGDQSHDSHGLKIRVVRPVFTKQDFNRTFDHGEPAASSGKGNKNCFKQTLECVGEKLRRSCPCPSGQCVKKSLLSFFPFIDIMRQYSIRNDLLNDVMSGLIVGVMHIPQGMAYGMLTKLDPVYGLYVSFFPVIFYFFFGTSRHISIGTFAVVSLMIGKVVEMSDCGELVRPVNETSFLLSNESYVVGSTNLTDASGDSGGGISEYKKCQLGIAVAVTFVVGLIQILLGALKFGFVTIYLSDPLTRALTMSAAIHVATSQVRHMFAVDMGRFSGPLKLVYMYVTFFKNIIRTNAASVILCLIGMAIIYSVQRWVNPRVKKKIKMPVPIELLLIVVTTLISYFAKFEERFSLPIVGSIPTGIPPPEFPPVSRFSSVASDAVGIAIVSFTINISMAKLFAKKYGYHLDSNQELLAQGITNCVCSSLNCYVSTASLSRSLVQEAAGGKTQVAGLISCCLLLVVLLAIAPLFYALPKCILAAIVLVNLKGILMQITDIPILYRNGQYYDLAIWLVTALSVIATDVDTGLYIGVAFSLLTIVFRTQRPRTSLLGRIPHTDLYEDVKAYPSARQIPGIKIFSFNSSLYYANAEYFTHKLYKRTGCNPEDIKRARKKQKQAVERAEKLNKAELKKQQKELEKQQKLRKKHKNRPVDGDDVDKNDAEVEKAALSEECVEVVHEIAPKDNCTVVNDNRAVELSSIHNIIIDCSSMMFVDTVGISAIQQVLLDYKEIGVRVHLACCRGDVYDKLQKAGVFKKTDNCTVFLGVHDAVLAAVDSDAALLHQLKIDSNGVLGSVFNANFDSDVNVAESDELIGNQNPLVPEG